MTSNLISVQAIIVYLSYDTAEYDRYQAREYPRGTWLYHTYSTRTAVLLALRV